MEITNGLIENGLYQNLDAAGRQRVSQVTNLGDYKILNGFFDTKLMEQIGTGTFTVNTNNVAMSVTSGQWAGIETKSYHPYINGKSQIIQITSTNMGTASNVEKEFGYISSTTASPFNVGLDGIRMFKDTSNNYVIQIWRGGSLLKQVTRANWDDPLDGTGSSEMVIDWNLFNVFTFDFLYLGGTTLKCYVHYEGVNYLFCKIFLSNTFDEPFLLSPNKKLRWLIRSTTGSGSLNMVCGAVGTEGQINSMGLNTTIKGNTAGITLANAGTKYAICGVRKKVDYRDVYSIVEGFEGIISTNDFIEWEIILNPTIAGSVTWADVTGTPLQSFVGVAANTVTGGFSLCNTYSSLNMNNARIIENILSRLNSTAAGVMDTIILVATPTLGSSNIKVTGSMQVRWIY